MWIVYFKFYHINGCYIAPVNSTFILLIYALKTHNSIPFFKKVLLGIEKVLIVFSISNKKFSKTNLLMYALNQTLNKLIKKKKKTTPSVPLCLSSIPFWDVPKYCPVSKNKSH